MRKIRLGVQLWPQHADYSAFRRAAREAEELGFDVLFNWDHFFPLSGDRDGKHYECWTMLASLAEVTERIEIGPLVACNSYRNPHLLADMARTVDHISGGRVILGIGSGWAKRDYEEYGYRFGTSLSRLKDLEESLPQIGRRLAALNPPPIREIPILIGGGGEKVTLRLVAEHADIWHVFGTPKELAHKGRVLEGWCAEVGRDPSEIERSAGVSTGELADPTRGDDLVAVGVSLLTLSVQGPDLPVRDLEPWIAWRDARNAGRDS